MKDIPKLLEEYRGLIKLPTPNIYQRSRILEIEQIYVNVMGSPISFSVNNDPNYIDYERV